MAMGCEEDRKFEPLSSHILSLRLFWYGLVVIYYPHTPPHLFIWEGVNEIKWLGELWP